MTVEEIYNEYIKLTDEERQSLLAKINRWLISRVEKKQQLEQENKLDVRNNK